MRWIDEAAAIDDRLYGPLPDLVVTQGVHLEPRPDTPVWWRSPGPNFEKELRIQLDLLLFVQKLRRRKYGDEDAEEWPISHTPPELQERYWESEREFAAMWEASTPPDSGSVGESDNALVLAPDHKTQFPNTPPSSSEGHPSRSKNVQALNDPRELVVGEGNRERIMQANGPKANMLSIESSPGPSKDLSMPADISRKRRYSEIDEGSEQMVSMGNKSSKKRRHSEVDNRKEQPASDPKDLAVQSPFVASAKVAAL